MNDPVEPVPDASATATDGIARATVPEAMAGSRLDRWLAGTLPGFSRNRLQALIAEGHLTLDGATLADPAHRVKPGQEAMLVVPPPHPAEPEAQAMDLQVRYEDEHLIVIDKPAGLVVHPAPGSPDGTLVNALLAHCAGQLSGIGGVERPGIVHRLDKDTSGLLVVAKSDPAHQGLVAQFQAHDLERAYKALVHGSSLAARGTVDAPIGRDPRDRKRMAVVRRGGRRAVTRYRAERWFGTRACLADCRLETGRTHQIRVHMAHLGHPVVGDPVYGGRRNRQRDRDDAAQRALAGFPRQALHAWLLGFRHPASGELLRFESNLPKDVSDLIDALEAD